MSQKNSNRAQTGLVTKYVGTAYDTVKIVADNIAAVIRVAGLDLSTSSTLSSDLDANGFDIVNLLEATEDTNPVRKLEFDIANTALGNGVSSALDLAADLVAANLVSDSAIAANTAKISYPTVDSNKLSLIEANAKDDQTGAEIKIAYEAEANTNGFTDAEKAKLAGLEDSKFLGEYTSLGALQTAHPSPAVGTYANVDVGVGNDVQRYLWDTDDSQYVLQLGTSTALTDAQIKTQYETNPDTNAFTDSEKTKLGSEVATLAGTQIVTGEKTFSSIIRSTQVSFKINTAGIVGNFAAGEVEFVADETAAFPARIYWYRPGGGNPGEWRLQSGINVFYRIASAADLTDVNNAIGTVNTNAATLGGRVDKLERQTVIDLVNGSNTVNFSSNIPHIIRMDATLGDSTASLPAAVTGQLVRVKKIDGSSTFNAVIVPNGAETIELDSDGITLTGNLKPSILLLGITGVGWELIA